MDPWNILGWLLVIMLVPVALFTIASLVYGLVATALGASAARRREHDHLVEGLRRQP